jgi:DNA-binding NarL/FixJ family response regulator
MLRIAMIDQQRVFVDALCFRLATEPGVEIVHASDNADNAEASLGAARPDLALIDAELPLARGFDLAAELRRTVPATKIVFLIRSPTDALLDQALRLGIEGLLTRSDSLTQLIQALRQVAGGERRVAPAVAARLDFDSQRGEYRLRDSTRATGLTTRQLEILRHLARGESVKSVAKKLDLSPKSVDNQKFRIMTKIGVRDKVNLALYAVREGLIEL